MIKIVFQRQALEEYREAAAHIAQDSAQNARLFIQRVEDALAYIQAQDSSPVALDCLSPTAVGPGHVGNHCHRP